MEDDDFVRELEQLVGDAVAESWARERAEERVLRDVAASEATFAGVALDLAERSTTVVARTASGRLHRGRILAVGRDFVAMREGSAPIAALALWSLSSLRPEPVPGAGVGDAVSPGRAAPVDVRLGAVLAGLAPERPRIAVVAAGDQHPTAGELRSVGVDVLTLRLDGDRRLTSYVRLDAVSEVLLLET